MEIGFDARMIDRSGIGRYIRSLLNEYRRMPVAGGIHIFGNKEELAEYSSHFKVEVVNFPIYRAGEQVLFPHKIRKFPVFHSPHYNAPLFYRGKLVVTLHDIIHIKYPPSRKANLYAKFMLRKVTARAVKLITASEHTKRDIIEHFNVSHDKIRVIPFGVGETFRPVEDEDLLSSFRKEYGLPDKFILYVGNLKHHKNLSTLFRAFRFLKTERKIEEGLVLTVGDNVSGEFTRSVFDERVEQWIKFLPHIPDEELPLLYNCAEVFVFPSLYEGFGLPPLEAMASGLPVVCSNAASLPEVVGESAIKCDPLDQGAFADGIYRLLTDSSLRNKLIREGRERAKLFSWTETAKRTAIVYNECLGR